MAKFTYEDDTLVSDPHGDISYDDAINAVIEEAVAKIEETLWNLVDEIEYVVGEEAEEPTDDESDMDDDDYDEDDDEE